MAHSYISFVSFVSAATPTRSLAIPAHRGEGKGRLGIWIILSRVRAAQESSLPKLSLRIVHRVRENSSEGAAAQIRSGRQYP